MHIRRSLDSIRKDIRARKTDLVSLVKEYITRAEENKDLNALVELYPDEALRSAEIIQEKFENGSEGKLAGLVIALKANLSYKDHLTSAASCSLSGYRSLYNATAVKKLIDADAIIIGSANCDEFAMGGTNETSYHGPVKNPIDHDRVPGGSSGGSAAAVAADLCLAALGSDTGGSIRQPASFCGLVELKPGYGRVSRYGLIAYGSSFDQIGPITWTAEDAAAILEVIAGKDGFDSTASSEEVPGYTKLVKQNDFPRKIAFLKEAMEHKGLDQEIRDRMEGICSELRESGFTVDPVSFPLLDSLVPAYYVMAMAEASSNLARYEGVHYGHRSTKATDSRDLYLKSRSEGFGTEVKRRIMTGTFVLSAGYYDAYYGKAQKVRRLIAEKTNEILDEYAYIMLPTTPRPAFGLGTMGDDPVALYLEDIFTTHANLAGIPAISLPLGKHSSGLPFGIQFMAARNREADLLSFSKNLLDNCSRYPGI